MSENEHFVAGAMLGFKNVFLFVCLFFSSAQYGSLFPLCPSTDPAGILQGTAAVATCIFPLFHAYVM